MDCDVLSLSLRVVRAYLCGENDKSYKEGKLDRLQQVKVPNEIHKRLKNSYEKTGILP